MQELTLFVQATGRPGISEVKLPEAATLSQLKEALASLGISPDGETFLFLDEAEEPLSCEPHERPGLRHGGRVHVARCRHINTTVHFQHRTAEHRFPPGARVNTVKHWAAHHFEMDPKDASEHVLQLCGSTQRPASDTRLHHLLHAHGCELCFDLVPDKRVEG